MAVDYKLAVCGRSQVLTAVQKNVFRSSTFCVDIRLGKKKKVCFWGINCNMQPIWRIERSRNIAVRDSNLPPEKLEILMWNRAAEMSHGTIPSLKFCSYFHPWYCRSALFPCNRGIWYGTELIPDHFNYCLPSLQCITGAMLRNRASACQSARNCASNTKSRRPPQVCACPTPSCAFSRT